MKKSRLAARSHQAAPRPAPTAAQWREFVLEGQRQRVPPGTCPICWERRLRGAQKVCSPRCKSDLNWAVEQRALLEPDVQATLRIAPILYAREFRLARHGHRFSGSKPGRMDALDRTLLQCLQGDPCKPGKEVWSSLIELCKQNHLTVRKVEGNKVYWKPGSGHRIFRETTYKSVLNRLTRLRSHLRSK